MKSGPFLFELLSGHEPWSVGRSVPDRRMGSVDLSAAARRDAGPYRTRRLLLTRVALHPGAAGLLRDGLMAAWRHTQV